LLSHVHYYKSKERKRKKKTIIKTKRKKKEKKILNNDLAVLPSHDNWELAHHCFVCPSVQFPFASFHWRFFSKQWMALEPFAGL